MDSQLLLAAVIAALGLGKTIGWLMARSESQKSREAPAPMPYDEWRRGVEVRLAAGDEKFGGIEDRFDRAGELISKLSTHVQGLQQRIEERADARYALAGECRVRHNDLDRRIATIDANARDAKEARAKRSP